MDPKAPWEAKINGLISSKKKKLVLHNFFVLTIMWQGINRDNRSMYK